MRFAGSSLQAEFKESFGVSVEQLTVRQMWCLVKIIKHCRLRCRSNAALYNYLNASFVGHRFKEVTKTHKDGTTYPGLHIESRTKPADVFVPASEEE